MAVLLNIVLCNLIVLTDVSDELTASIIRAMIGGSKLL
jgi:hypothetical protein